MMPAGEERLVKSQSHLCGAVCTFLNVGVGVLETGRLAGLAADQTVQVGSGLVAATLLHGVALGASLDEDLLALLGVSWHASVGRECAVEPTDEGVMKSLRRRGKRISNSVEVKVMVVVAVYPTVCSKNKHTHTHTWNGRTW